MAAEVASHVVVPEGLTSSLDAAGTNVLSDYFEAVLRRVAADVPRGERVYVSPGNTFDHARSEEEYGATFLALERSDLDVEVPVHVRDRRYLDTFDNARVLRGWLDAHGRWPLPPVTLYCNAPHALRAYVLFRLCGFDVARVVGCRPREVRRQIVRRLWFYDNRPVQIVYEALGIVYGSLRWAAWRLSRSRRRR